MLNRSNMKKSLIFVLMAAIISIVSSCGGSEEVESTNPLLSEWTTLFGVPPFDQIKVYHYQPAFEEAMRLHDEQINQIASQQDEPTFENTIESLENSGKLLSQISRVLSLISSADMTPELQKVHAEIMPTLSYHNDGIYLNEQLFRRVEEVYQNRAELGLDQQQMRLVELTRRNFVRAGSLLMPEDKQRLMAINHELVRLSLDFSNNLLEENKNFALVVDNQDDLKGLSDAVKDAASQAASAMDLDGKWVFKANRSSMLPFLSYAENAELRKQLHDGYIMRGNNDNEFDNKEIVQNIVRLRSERARLLGFDTHADYVLDVTMAKTPDNVYKMLDELWTPALALAKSELADMKEIKLKETGSDEFLASDWWYYAEKVRRDKYDLNEEQLLPYFSLDNVKAGIFELSNRLYGLTFRPINVPLYNKECEAYEVLDKDGTHLAVLYLDFFPREGKGAGAWCGTFRRQSYENGQRVAPVVSIVCNFTPSTRRNVPALLTLDETETFFHEFGHAIHSFVSDVRYASLTRVERDFVELPSQIMENWALEPELLRRYARHYSSNKVISEEMIRKISESRLFNQGFATVEYLAAAISDMDLHTLGQREVVDLNRFEATTLGERRGLIEQIAPRYHYTYFSHLFDFDYSAGYYSYIWAEVLDKDAYEAFKESGDTFNPRVAASFRANILSKGGISDGDQMYRQFRGRDASVEPLMNARGL